MGNQIGIDLSGDFLHVSCTVDFQRPSTSSPPLHYYWDKGENKLWSEVLAEYSGDEDCCYDAAWDDTSNSRHVGRSEQMLPKTGETLNDTAGVNGTLNDTAGVNGTLNDTAGVNGTLNDTAGVNGTLNDTAGVNGTLNDTAGVDNSHELPVAVSGNIGPFDVLTSVGSPKLRLTNRREQKSMCNNLLSNASPYATPNLPYNSNHSLSIGSTELSSQRQRYHSTHFDNKPYAQCDCPSASQLQHLVMEAKSSERLISTALTTAHQTDTAPVCGDAVAESPHTAAKSPHTAAKSPHTAAESPHTAAMSPHTAAESPHTAAESPHTAAESPHTAAMSPHTAAKSPHTAAMSPHTAAESPHTAQTPAKSAHTSLAAVPDSSDCRQSVDTADDSIDVTLPQHCPDSLRKGAGGRSISESGTPNGSCHWPRDAPGAVDWDRRRRRDGPGDLQLGDKRIWRDSLQGNEKKLWDLFTKYDFCRDVKCFCVTLPGGMTLRIYCFFIPLDRTEEAIKAAIALLPEAKFCTKRDPTQQKAPPIPTALQPLNQPYFIEVTGSGTSKLSKILDCLSRRQYKSATPAGSENSSLLDNSPICDVSPLDNATVYFSVPPCKSAETLISTPDSLEPSTPYRPDFLTPSRPDILTPSRPDILTPSRPDILTPSRPDILTPSRPDILTLGKLETPDSFFTATSATLPCNSSAHISSSAAPKIPVELQFHREITCVLEAVDFLVCHAPRAIFSYASTYRGINTVVPDTKNYSEVPLSDEERKSFYPFLLINLKAGVSFHKVVSPGESCRIGGSPIGGGTFMGLFSLLCPKVKSPFDAFLMAERGDNSKVDMLVRDIYGGDYPAVGLKGTTLASSFGKAQRDSQTNRSLQSRQHSSKSDNLPSENATRVADKADKVDCGESLYSDIGNTCGDCSEPTDDDVCRSLLTMMSFNVAQLAYLHSVIHCCPRICLAGYYLDVPSYLASIQHCIEFWSQGSCKIAFFRFSPFLGAIGASLRKRRRRTSTAHLPDWVTDDRSPSPHRMLYHLHQMYVMQKCGDDGLFFKYPKGIN